MPSPRLALLAACTAALVPALAGEAATPAPKAVDRTHLALGDGKLSTTAARGSVLSCQTAFNQNAGGAFRDGPWIRADGTWDQTAKVTVDDAVSWPGTFTVTRSATRRTLAGNGLPSAYKTGTYPISPADDAYQYDRNPNTITTQTVHLELPAVPKVAAQPSCVPMGTIGVTTAGVAVFNALDALGRDAVAHEIQDACDGHPERSGAYHHHSVTACLPDPGKGHSALVGYALDGFGIYGHRGTTGAELTNADLDACHGHSHAITWDGARVSMFHYHATWEYPYTVGCFRGTPALVPRAASGPAGGPAGGAPGRAPRPASPPPSTPAP